jgi:hypothetical protein
LEVNIGGIDMFKKSLLTRIRRRFKDKKGQSTTEYILILAIVVMIASKMKTKLGTVLDSKVDSLQKDISAFD